MFNVLLIMTFVYLSLGILTRFVELIMFFTDSYKDLRNRKRNKRRKLEE